MASMQIKLDSSEIQSLLKSNDVISGLQRYGDQIAKRAGDGYKTDQHVGKTRANVSVYPDTKEAWKDLYANNTLLKAIQ